MRQIIGTVRRCVDDYGMIREGDRIAVGISGGKDSLLLLRALAELRRFYPQRFELQALTLDLGVPGMCFDSVAELCRELEVPYTVVPTQIYQVIFEERKEKNPCSLCARMRKGALNDAAIALGCRKVALGHHFDDAIETFFLSLFYEGRISCFQPVTDLDRSGILQIRPLVYTRESSIVSAAQRLNLPVVHNPCPADGYTKRQEIKELVAELSQRYPDLKNRVMGAMQRRPLDGWGKMR